jgi:hypothetical protein
MLFQNFHADLNFSRAAHELNFDDRQHLVAVNLLDYAFPIHERTFREEHLVADRDAA